MLVPPDAARPHRAAPGKRGGLYQRMRERLATPTTAALYRRRMAMIEPIFGHTKANRAHRALPPPRTGRRPLGMAADRRHPQPAQAPRRRLSGASGRLTERSPAAARRERSPATAAPRGPASRDAITSGALRAPPLTSARQPLWVPKSHSRARRAPTRSLRTAKCEERARPARHSSGERERRRQRKVTNVPNQPATFVSNQHVPGPNRTVSVAKRGQRKVGTRRSPTPRWHTSGDRPLLNRSRLVPQGRRGLSPSAVRTTRI